MPVQTGKMRRVGVTLVAAFIFLLAVAVRFYPDLKRWLPAARRTLAPVATPGPAPIEGPYFSDGNRVADRVIAAISQIHKSLHIAICDLTQPEITAAIEAAPQSREPHSEIP